MLTQGARLHHTVLAGDTQTVSEQDITGTGRRKTSPFFSISGLNISVQKCPRIRKCFSLHTALWWQRPAAGFLKRWMCSVVHSVASFWFYSPRIQSVVSSPILLAVPTQADLAGCCLSLHISSPNMLSVLMEQLIVGSCSWGWSRLKAVSFPGLLLILNCFVVQLTVWPLQTVEPTAGTTALRCKLKLDTGIS